MSTKVEPNLQKSATRIFKNRNKLLKSSNVLRFKPNIQKSSTDFKILKKLHKKRITTLAQMKMHKNRQEERVWEKVQQDAVNW